MPDPETGEPIPVSHMIPRSREDLLRRGKALRQRRRIFGRPDGPHARLYERHLRRLCRPAPTNGQPTATRPAPNGWSPTRNSCAAATSRSPTRSFSRPSTRRWATRRRRATPCAAQGRRHRARHRRARRARARHPGAVRRRDRGLSRRPLPDRRRRLCAVVLHPDERAGTEIPLPRQRLGVSQPLRPSVVEPLRRAGRLRHLRRRRGPARPPVHRLQPRRLQLGDDHELAGQHPAADHDPRLGEARLRLGSGAAHGGRRSTPPIPRPCA